MPFPPAELSQALKKEALRIGFSGVGITPAVRPPGVDHLDEWLAAGYAGDMGYLAERREAYDHPGGVLEGARSLVMLTLDYRTAEPQSPDAGQGRVARYAWGESDYHDLIRPKLHTLADRLRELAPDARTRGVVDTAPLLEREYACLAGLGWIGKNTLLLGRERGSYFFLAALITDIDLEPDQPHPTDHCGSCTACLDACPTDAFPSPGVLDGSRCISYLTIEARGLPAREMRPAMGDWLFGCDVCQEVCPWNRFAPPTAEPVLQPRDDSNPIDLVALMGLDDRAFRERFRHTPLWRPRRRGLLRNAAIALGNSTPPGGERALTRALSDREPLVRAAAAWALGRYRTESSRESLRARADEERDPMVTEEIVAALDGHVPG